MVKGKENYIFQLKKRLHGLKQALRQWYKKFKSVIREHGYKKTSSNYCAFVQKFPYDDCIILLLYIDDKLIVAKNSSRIENLNKQLTKFFAVKDLVPAKQILSVQISRDRKKKELHMS